MFDVLSFTIEISNLKANSVDSDQKSIFLIAELIMYTST